MKWLAIRVGCASLVLGSLGGGIGCGAHSGLAPEDWVAKFERGDIGPGDKLGLFSKPWIDDSSPSADGALMCSRLLLSKRLVLMVYSRMKRVEEGQAVIDEVHSVCVWEKRNTVWNERWLFCNSELMRVHVESSQVWAARKRARGYRGS